MNNTKKVKIGKYDLLCRKDSTDYSIASAVIIRETYKALKPKEGDIVLDAGAHIGSFALWVSPKVKKVFSFEPEETNFALLNQNLLLNKIANISTYKQAIIGSRAHQDYLYLNRMTNKATHSFLVKRGRDATLVDCENVNQIIKNHGITIAKVDIEGAESEVLKAITKTNYRKLRSIIFEYHFQQLKDHDHRIYFGLIELLKTHFKKVIYLKKPSKHFTTIVVCHK
jgi:FkbM family methyltransferase